jgi:hypothetical protein
MSVVAPNARASVVPRPSGFRPKAATLVASPAPPSPGSTIPPAPRPRVSSCVDLIDADIVEVAPAPRSSSVPPPMRRSTVPPPTPLKKIVVEKRDPVDLVKEAIGELEYFSTPWQAAGICAQALAKALGARAVMIHTHCSRTTEIRVVAAVGPKSDVLLGASALVEDDFVGSTVVANRKPMTMFIDGELPRIAPDRLRAVGAARSLVTTPAIAQNDVVAMIEVVDAETTSDRTDRAMSYAAKQLATFLTSKKK